MSTWIAVKFNGEDEAERVMKALHDAHGDGATSQHR